MAAANCVVLEKTMSIVLAPFSIIIPFFIRHIIMVKRLMLSLIHFRDKQKSLKEPTLHAGIFWLFAAGPQNSMNGLHRLARWIYEIHVCPPTSAEIRQYVPAK